MSWRTMRSCPAVCQLMRENENSSFEKRDFPCTNERTRWTRRAGSAFIGSKAGISQAWDDMIPAWVVFCCKRGGRGCKHHVRRGGGQLLGGDCTPIRPRPSLSNQEVVGVTDTVSRETWDLPGPAADLARKFPKIPLKTSTPVCFFFFSANPTVISHQGAGG
jgi:hypothetical protein